MLLQTINIYSQFQSSGIIQLLLFTLFEHILTIHKTPYTWFTDHLKSLAPLQFLKSPCKVIKVDVIACNWRSTNAVYWNIWQVRYVGQHWKVRNWTAGRRGWWPRYSRMWM